MSKTRKNMGRGSATRGWKKEQPGYHQKNGYAKKMWQKMLSRIKKIIPNLQKKYMQS